MLGRIRREAESITINNTGILGLQSVSAEYDSVGGSPLLNLGIREIQYAPQGPQTATLQLNTMLTHVLDPVYSSQFSLDVMQNLTGNIPFSGVIDYGSEKIYFSEGYLETYSISCAIGQVPQTSTSSVIFGDFGTGELFSDYAQGTALVPALNIPSYSSMEVNLDEFSTNRMTSFSIDIATPRLPIYAVNNDKPTEVIPGNPVEVRVNFSLDVDDYKIKDMRLIPDETTFRNASITLNKNNSDVELLKYSFDNMVLISESFQAGVDSNAEVNFNLRSFILR